MTTNTLLPPNATPQELALEQAMRPGEDVLAGIELIRSAKENPPDDWLYWLVWEYGLEELLPYLPDPRIALERGLQWQRIRGTPASVRLALSWLDLEATIEETDPLRVHWYEYQLNPGKVPSRAELENLVGLARLSAPVGTRLARVFYGYDYRRGVYDYSRWSDGSLYSDDSGIYDPDLDVDLSFGRTFTSSSELGDVVVTSSHTSISALQVRYEDRAFYDFSEYDDLIIRNELFSVNHERWLFGQGVGRNIRVLDGSWRLDGSVLLAGETVAELPQFPATHTSFTEPEGIIGWGSQSWGNVNWYGY